MMEIHVQLAGVQLGPFSEKEVRGHLADGFLTLSDPVRLEGTQHWIPVGELLANLPPPVAAPVLEEPPASPPPLAPATEEASVPSWHREIDKRANLEAPTALEEPYLPTLDDAPASTGPIVEVTAPEPETVLIPEVILPPVPVSEDQSTSAAPPSKPPRATAPTAKSSPEKKKSALSQLVLALNKTETPRAPTVPLPTPPTPPSVSIPEVIPKSLSPKPIEKQPETTLLAIKSLERKKAAARAGTRIGKTTAAPTPEQKPVTPATVLLPLVMETKSFPDREEQKPAPPAEEVHPFPTVTKLPVERVEPVVPETRPEDKVVPSPPALVGGKVALPSRKPSAGFKEEVPDGPPSSPAVTVTLTKTPTSTLARLAPKQRGAPTPPGVKPLTQPLQKVTPQEPTSPPASPPGPETLVVAEPEIIAPPKVELEQTPIAAGKVEAPPPPQAKLTRRPRPFLTPRWVTYSCASLCLLLLLYATSPYRAASSLWKALLDGDPIELARAVDFPSIRQSLKQQVEAQLSNSAKPGTNGAAPADSASGDAQAMLDQSIDLYLSPEGIAALVKKADTFPKTHQKPIISPERASNILHGLTTQSVRKQGLAGLGEFVIEVKGARLHLALEGAHWKLNRIELKADLPLPNLPTPILSPLVGPALQTYLDDANARSQKSDWAGAIASFTQVLAINPQSSAAYAGRGFARQSKGDRDGALLDYDQALELDPKLAGTFEQRGDLKAAKSDFAGAIADYDQALQLEPKRAAALLNRGKAKTATNDLDGAVTDFTQALALDSNPVNQASYYNNRGTAKQSKGDIDGAIADYTQALTLSPRIAGANYNRGLARMAKGDNDAAQLDFDQALNLDPKLFVAYYNRGNIKYGKGEWNEAISDYTQALALSPKFADAYGKRGLARQAKGDLDGALADFAQALNLDPHLDMVYYYRALIKYERDDLDGAISDNSQALAIDPKNVQAYYNRGLAKLTKGDLDGAMTDLRQFCDFDPRDSFTDYARLYLWLISEAQGGKIHSDAELATSLDNSWNAAPDDMATRIAGFLLGRISEVDFLAGAAAATDAKKAQRQECEAWYFAGMSRLLAGDKPTATDYFHRCVATGEKDYCEYILARTELKGLQPGPH